MLKICPGSCFIANIDPRNLIGLGMSPSNVKHGGSHSLEKGQEPEDCHQEIEYDHGASWKLVHQIAKNPQESCALVIKA